MFWLLQYFYKSLGLLDVQASKSARIQKPAHFLSAKMAVLSSSFSVFIEIEMYNFGVD